jgi:hypothetical protein
MNTSPQKHIKVVPLTFDACNFVSDPISKLGDRS